ncbi:MAG: ATP-binding protein [Oligoflexales bacterium]
MFDQDEEEVLFEFEEEGSEEVSTDEGHDSPYLVLVVDDEPEVHSVTEMVLSSYKFAGRGLKFLNAYDRTQACDLIEKHQKDISLILLDVVMDTPDAGLLVVQYIRETLKNPLLRIILRTGQPGEAPESEVIMNYDINDYRLKTEVTRERLFASVTVALRTWQYMKELIEMRSLAQERSEQLEVINQNLDQKVQERTQEVYDKNIKLLENVQQKRSLLRVLSHDLSNYLSIILYSSQMLLQNHSYDQDKVQKILERIKRSADKQSDIINSVREVDAITSGKHQVTLVPVSLNKAFENACFTFREKLEAKSLDLILENDRKDEVFILGEPTIFENSILNNLISNALKFSPHGERIVVKIETKQDQEKICLSVQDKGIGIPKEIIKDLFSLDAATSRPGTDGEKGTGFGMPLVKNYLGLLSGSIEVDSIEQVEGESSSGTTFKIFLPKPTE